jgi:hypothetical protein
MGFDGRLRVIDTSFEGSPSKRDSEGRARFRLHARRQRHQLLSLALSATLQAANRTDALKGALCRNAVCELGCPFVGTPPIAHEVHRSLPPTSNLHSVALTISSALDRMLLGNHQARATETLALSASGGALAQSECSPCALIHDRWLHSGGDGYCDALSAKHLPDGREMRCAHDAAFRDAHPIACATARSSCALSPVCAARLNASMMRRSAHRPRGDNREYPAGGEWLTRSYPGLLQLAQAQPRLIGRVGWSTNDELRSSSTAHRGSVER